ncbi:MAG: hypothetical protein BWZ06_01116 [Bacteroidetes bacterium ADurb.BinA261]|nr:MAG: hypothetical protein BWZ06_01116 [Bacteroidetes bacterium ADurb.BinA261]
MTPNNDWFCPTLHVARNIATNDWFAKNSSSHNITNSSIRRFPHLFEAKFLHPSFIGSDCSTFDPYIISFNGFGCFHGNLIVGGIAIFDTQIIIFDIEIEIWQDQLLFDKCPNDARHFIAIKFYNRVLYFNFIHANDFFGDNSYSNDYSSVYNLVFLAHSCMQGG